MSLWTHEHSTANTGSMADYAAPTLRKKANRRKEKSRAPVLKTAELLKNLQLGGSSIGGVHDADFGQGGEAILQDEDTAEVNGETPAEDERAVQHVSIGRPIDLAVRVKPVIFKAEAMASSTLLDGVEKSLTGQAEKPIAERAQVDPASNEAIHLRDINKKLAAKIDSLEASLELYKARNKALEGKVMRQERQIHQNNVDISDMTSTIHDLVMSEGGAARI